MLFEIFLVIGITLVPISFLVWIMGQCFDDIDMLKTSIIMAIVGVACLVLAVILARVLPPIPIIPQGG